MSQGSETRIGGGDERNDQRGWTANGNSTQIGRDQNNTTNYYGVTGAGQTTQVLLESRKPSVITSGLSRTLAFLSSLITVGVFAWDIVQFRVVAPTDEGAWEPNRLVESLGAVFAGMWVPGLASIAGVVISVALWRFFRARHLAWPIYYGRWSRRRALLPSLTTKGEFYRARVKAECLECRYDNRPDVYGKLYRDKDNRDGIVSYTCKNRHHSRFRGRSIFVEGSATP